MGLKGQKTTTSAMDWDDFKSLIFKLERDGELKYCLLIAAGVFMGLRISDLLKLRFCDIEDVDMMTIIEQKTKKQRKIKINPDLQEIVKRVRPQMGVTDTTQLIFLNRYETKAIDRSWVNVNLKRIFKKYKIETTGNISSHTLRKTMANRVLRLNNYSNESILLLNECFLHSNLSVTKKYLGIREKEVMDVYDSLKL